MRIAVLGGGNGSYAAAADLTELGHEVRFWRRNAAAFGEALTSGMISLRDGKGSRQVKIAMITDELAPAVDGADLILLPAPAFSQIDIAKALAPLLVDDQVIFLPPGTFGSFAMMKAIRDAGSSADIAIAETGTLPYLTRKKGSDSVAITVRAVRLPTGVFPGRRTEFACGVIAQAYPVIHPVEDALSGALMNGGPIIHPPLILMNAGPLEHFDAWDIHNEGTQPSVRAVTDALDEERILIREALGYRPYHYPLRDTYSSDRWMYGDTHKVLTDSGDWREKIDLKTHRYMTEDVHFGLAFLVSVADWLEIPVPVAKGLLGMASAICGKDLRGGERTLDALGLSGLDRSGMSRMLQEGIRA